MKFTMDKTISLRFESQLDAPPDRIWEWITSLDGISTEMWPFFRMTFPKGVRSLNDVVIKPGIRIFRSYIFLFGILPVDYSDMTLMELDIGRGFVEQSPMGSSIVSLHFLPPLLPKDRCGVACEIPARQAREHPRQRRHQVGHAVRHPDAQLGAGDPAWRDGLDGVFAD